MLTVVLVIVAPPVLARYELMAAVSAKAWFILTVVTVFLVLKSVLGDLVAGEFLFHKFGYDNCVMTFGATLTAFALQLVAGTDLFPGLSSVVLLRDVPQVWTDPGANRSLQLFVLLALALTITLLTGAISAAINKGKAKGPAFLSLLNTALGLFLLGLYVLVLVTKG